MARDIDLMAEIKKIEEKINREQEKKKRLLERQRIKDEKHKQALGAIAVDILGDDIQEDDLRVILEEWAGNDMTEEEKCVGEYDQPEHH